MVILGKAEILEAVDIVTEEVAVPEWAGSVLVKAMTGAERDAFEESVLRKSAAGGYETIMTNMRAKLLVRTLVDADGEQLFAAEDVAALGEKSAEVLDRLFDVASRLSGVSADDVEELAKNSEGVLSDDSGLD